MTDGIAYERIPYVVVSRQPRTVKEVYGAIDDFVVLQAQLLRSERPSKTVAIAMHPIGAPAYLPMVSGLAKMGFHVIACASRYVNGDQALLIENVLLDLGACVRDAKERWGYERVILVGWSGGGPLISTYQAQAEKPTIQALPSGEPCDLVAADLTPADGVVLIASHRSRHHLLTDWLDPSVTDEQAPIRGAAELDLYDPANPSRPPYSDAFLATYREAQRSRNRRITAWVKEQLNGLVHDPRQGPGAERCFVVHGTMADPRWLDPTVDPNDREVNTCYLGDPRAVNDSPIGLARFTTLRAWLSQWSLDDARADSVVAVGSIRVPILVVENSADDACPASHARMILDAIPHPDKEFHVVKSGNHYLSGPGQRDQLADAVGAVTDWATSRRLDDLPAGQV